jgi:hypothetical protein
VETRLTEVLQSEKEIYKAISQSKYSNIAEHTNTRSTISSQIESHIAVNEMRHDSVVEQIDAARNGILEALNTTAEEIRAERSVTRAEFQRVADLNSENDRANICQSGSLMEGNHIIPVTCGNVLPVELKNCKNGISSKSVSGSGQKWC